MLACLFISNQSEVSYKLKQSLHDFRRLMAPQTWNDVIRWHVPASGFICIIVRKCCLSLQQIRCFEWFLIVEQMVENQDRDPTKIGEVYKSTWSKCRDVDTWLLLASVHATLWQLCNDQWVWRFDSLWAYCCLSENKVDYWFILFLNDGLRLTQSFIFLLRSLTAYTAHPVTRRIDSAHASDNCVILVRLREFFLHCRNR